MTVHLDTCVLIDALTGRRRSLERLIALVDARHRIALSTVVLYEWWRGPRTRADLEAQEDLFPVREAVAFGADEAARAADLYRRLRHPRGREVDLAVAACAVVADASLWTLNPDDFRDIPGLQLV